MKLKPIHLVFALTLLLLTAVHGGRVLLALYALRLGAQPFVVGALAAAFSAFPMLLSWQTGRLSDRFDARWMLMFGAGGSACGMLVPYLFPSLPALFLAAAIIGMSLTVHAVSVQNLVGMLGKADEHARDFSNFAMVAAVGTALGPAISGFSIDHMGFGLACLSLVSPALLGFALLAIRGGILPGLSGQSGPRGSFKDLLADRKVLKVLATSTLVQLGVEIFQFYTPIYGYGIGLSASAIGVILAMFAVASFAVRLVLPRLIARFGEETVLSYAFFFGAASLALMPFFRSAALLCFFAFLFGLGMGCGAPITMMLTYSQSLAGRSGEALGLRFTANHVARVFGPLVFGSIGTAFGLFPVFWGNAVMMVCGALISRSGARGNSNGRDGRA